MNKLGFGRRGVGVLALACAAGFAGPAAVATSPISTRCQAWAVGQPRDDKSLAVFLKVTSQADSPVPGGTVGFTADRKDHRYTYDFHRKYSTPKVFHLGKLHAGSYNMYLVYDPAPDSNFSHCSTVFAFEVRKTD